MKADTHEDLTRAVAVFRRWIQALAACVIGTYFIWFVFYLRSPVSPQAEAWGQFGDFVGGLLNPLIAYAAFHWLARSVLIQGKELADTRAALKEAAMAQAAQADHASKSIAISLIRARVDAVAANIGIAEKEREFVANQFAKHSGNYASHTMDGGMVPGSAIREHLAEKTQEVRLLVAERDRLIEEMSALASMHSAA